MENPATWTQLHRSISQALSSANESKDQAAQVLKILGDTKLSLSDIQQIIDEQRQSRRCGLSIPAQIFNAHNN